MKLMGSFDNTFFIKCVFFFPGFGLAVLWDGWIIGLGQCIVQRFDG